MPMTSTTTSTTTGDSRTQSPARSAVGIDGNDTQLTGWASTQKSKNVFRTAEEWNELHAKLPQLAAELPEGLQFVPAANGTSDQMDRIFAALYRDGAVCLLNAVSVETAQQCIEEMTPYLDEQDYGDAFLGKQTRRVGAVVGRSPASWQMAAHPALLAISEGIIGYQVTCLSSREDFAKTLWPPDTRHPVQLHLSQIIHRGAGQANQPLHRDAGAFVVNFDGKLEPEVSTIWALNDFTPENGPTRVVPGSHRWPRDTKVSEKKHGNLAVSAVMPAGSVIVYLGHTYHSAGNNASTQERWGLNIDYCFGWLRQEENQYLSIQPSVARTLPTVIQDLIGYKMGGLALGYFDAMRDPKEAGKPGMKPINWATSTKVEEEAARSRL